MEPTPYIEPIEPYLDQLSVIRYGRVEFNTREPAADRILACICSMVLHAGMLFIFSLSMFRAPAMVVSNEPISVWLIPFISDSTMAVPPDAAHQADPGKSGSVVNEIPEADSRVPLFAARYDEPAAAPEFTDVDKPAEVEMIVVRKPKTVPPVPAPPPRAAPVKTVSPPPVQRAVTAQEPAGSASQKSEPAVETVRLQPPAPVAPPPGEPLFSADAASGAEQRPIEPPVPPRQAAAAREAITIQPTPLSEQSRKESAAAAPVTKQPVPARMQPKPETAATAPPRQAPAKVQAVTAEAAAGQHTPQTAAVRPNGLPLPAAPPAAARTAAAPAPSAATAVKPAVARGIAAPRINGDIKLIVSGTAMPAVSITFREFAESRRSRPLSRAEARRESGVIPLTSALDGAQHIVVAQAHAGIYTITATARDGSAGATFVLKLYEGKARESSRKLGGTPGPDRRLVIRLLMPDGILWDDESAFSGSLEDSESVTKFNTETGLTWKEYNP